MLSEVNNFKPLISESLSLVEIHFGLYVDK